MAQLVDSEAVVAHPCNHACPKRGRGSSAGSEAAEPGEEGKCDLIGEQQGGSGMSSYWDGTGLMFHRH